MNIPRSPIEWDHERMEQNWQCHDDDTIAHRFLVTANTVKGYRLRRGWKRTAQRYHGGPKSNSAVMQAIAQALTLGTELHLQAWQLGSRSHVTIQATIKAAGIRSEVHILPSLNCLPRILKELAGELETKRTAA